MRGCQRCHGWSQMREILLVIVIGVVVGNFFCSNPEGLQAQSFTQTSLNWVTARCTREINRALYRVLQVSRLDKRNRMEETTVGIILHYYEAHQ